MSRRIGIAMVGMVLITLLVASVSTATLSNIFAAQSTREALLRQVLRRQTQPKNLIALTCERNAQARVNAEGSVLPLLDADPDPDLPEKVDVSRLAQGFVVSGTENGVAYAAFPCPVRPRSTTGYFFVQFATETTSSGLGKVRRGLLAGAAVAIAVALGVALLLSRRLTRPILAVRRATQQIADGDLTVRIPEDEPGELGELGASINQMAAALQRARGLEQQFLLSVSHDLRTPLTSIRGYAEALADGTMTDVGRGAAIIQEQSQRLERLVADLLDLAKLQTHQFQLRLTPVDLFSLAREATAGFAAAASQAGVSLLVTNGGDRSAIVTADVDRLGQVAANLIENAMKYAHSRVEVGAGFDAGGAWLSVTDDGPGIAAEDLPHVFERLYVTAHAPKRKESGSGLGLAIVRELVQAMGGTVTATSGAGTQIVVRLPLASSMQFPSSAAR